MLKLIYKYLNNKFINKDDKNKSNALSILSIRSSILSLLNLKKRNYKKEQLIKGIHK